MLIAKNFLVSLDITCLELASIGLAAPDVKRLQELMRTAKCSNLKGLVAKYSTQLYHREFFSATTYRFLRTIVGLKQHGMIDNRHMRAISFGATLADYIDYKCVMEAFWENRFLSSFLYASLYEFLHEPTFPIIITHWAHFFFPIYKCIVVPYTNVLY